MSLSSCVVTTDELWLILGLRHPYIAIDEGDSRPLQGVVDVFEG